MASQWITAGHLTGLLGDRPWQPPVYRDLSERIRLLVVDGQLPDGSRLPSERDLCAALGLSRTTVTSAYAELRALDVLRARRGAGNFVHQPDDGLASPLLPMPLPGQTAEGVIALNAAASTAPPGLGAAYQRAAERLPSLLAGTGYFPDGLEPLRTAVADWFTGRGLPTRSGQIIVTSGSLSAWNVILRTFANPGDSILMESPTYCNAIVAARQSRTRLVPFPITSDNWDPGQFESIASRSRANLAFLIPDFQNPTGVWLDEDQRRAAARTLNRHRITTVVDETLVELRLDDDPPRTPMGGLLPEAITIGSASKSFWGGLRIGWIRAPNHSVRRLIETQATIDIGTAPYEQLVAAELIRDSESVLRHQRQRLRRQRDHLVAEIINRLPGWELRVPRGGLSLWCRLPAESSRLLSGVARQHNLVLTPGPRFYPSGGGRRHLRIPFVADVPVLTEAVRRLELAWQQAESDAVGTRGRQIADLIV